MNVELVKAVCRPCRGSDSLCGGRWSEIDGAEKATCLSFNAWGTVLSVGEKDGVVSLWDYSTIQTIIRELNPKMYQGLPDFKQATVCAWSANGRILAVACELKASGKKGSLLFWDVESNVLMAAVAVDSMITHVMFPPRTVPLSIVSKQDNTYTLLVTCLNGDVFELVVGPKVEDTDDDEDAQEEAPLQLIAFHAKDSGHIEAPALQLHVRPIDMNAMVTKAIGEPTATPSVRNQMPFVIAKYGPSVIYCLTIKGLLAMIDPITLKLIKGVGVTQIQHVDLYVDDKIVLIPSTKGIHELCATSLQEVQIYTAGAAVRSPWIMCTLSHDGQFVLGLPLPRGIMVGEKGMYLWKRPETTESPPLMWHENRFSMNMTAIAWHPVKESLTVISASGTVNTLDIEYKSPWPGAMYPPGFTLITDNVIYEEPEDEFDTNIKLCTYMQTNDANEVVDVINVQALGKQFSDDLKYVSAAPLASGEVLSEDTPNFGSVFRPMKREGLSPPKPAKKSRKLA
ncbi:hypothetical protein THRCLA_11543 [Thraustotheca clavata]|uniref:Uncharacterized protein n=1 Tax=Thraustotheca clavata TaxID=74557 RepID=A0A1V9Y7E8_9STRA|nr:hypothetical protein THRCLA_11543 [Thraustotheca clavata]